MFTTACLVLSLAFAPTLAVDEEPPADENPHSRAPYNVPLIITEGARVLAAYADGDDDDYANTLFPQLSEKHPGRFTQDGDGIWRDTLNEYTYNEDDEAYWQQLTAEDLTRGRQDYLQFCASCHGFDGDGYGRSGQALRPPPRDFRSGMFKFTKVNSEKLPSDDALIDLIQKGLDGTPMLPWDVPEARLRDIIAYIKTLSDVDEELGWADPYNQIGVPIATDGDPWKGKESQAVEAGRRLYHSTYQCYSCHPGYATPAEVNAFRGTPADTAYPDLLVPKLKESSYAVRGYDVKILPPDFTWHTMRRGRDVDEIYQTIAGGIGGAGMPTWKGAGPDEDLWAIAYYVDDLITTYLGDRAYVTEDGLQRDTPRVPASVRAEFMAGLRGDG